MITEKEAEYFFKFINERETIRREIFYKKLEESKANYHANVKKIRMLRQHLKYACRDSNPIAHKYFYKEIKHCKQALKNFTVHRDWVHSGVNCARRYVLRKYQINKAKALMDKGQYDEAHSILLEVQLDQNRCWLQ